VTTPDVRLRRVDAVVIGTSAGGVQALSEILPALRPDCAASIFVVLHLPRERPSRLVEIFAPKCAVPVREALDKDPVEPGVVYFAPPDYHLLLDVGPQVVLSVDDVVHYSRPSVDVLFESAADVYGDRLMAVVLTGANEDGSSGLAAVCDAGGWAVVQEPATAQAPMMVVSALKRCPDALVLELSGIAELFGQLNARYAV
jgi:two-component system, chemotaxis family, protein-glutamate methylesterase/glutaminase